jgi:hypothetical protein
VERVSNRGTALVAALVIIMILLPLGVFVALQCRMDLAIQRNLRTEIEAFYVAEAGLQHAVAEIRPGTSFDYLLLGPDHTAGTADDGVFPFAEGSPAAFPRAPFHYEVTIVDAGHGTIRLISRGLGEQGAVRVVEGLVRRSESPFTPAALYAEGDLSGFDLGTNGFSLSGFDHRPDDSNGSTSEAHPPVAALCGTRPDIEAFLRERFPDAVGRLVGAGGTPSVATGAALGLQDYVSAVSQRPECVVLPPTSGGNLVFGTQAAPRLTRVAGSLDVSDFLTGSGLLVVDGLFHVTGEMQFYGLVIAMGGVVFETSSRVSITGALWSGCSQDERVQFHGTGAVAYSGDALIAADRNWPTLLPHAVALAGWQEQL